MEYLLFLQTLREGSGSALTPLFVFISDSAVAGGPIILAFVYWCVDKRMGAWGLFNLALGQFVTEIVKLTACVNRPWVKDSRISLCPQAAKTATGYSFPSGHTTLATSTYGSVAVWQRKRTWIAVPLAVLVLLTAFSRNWLGAHTLQDVLAAIGLVALVMFVNTKAMRYLDEHPEKDIAFAAAIILLCVLGAVYVLLKPYPMDYGPTGELLVDPKMMTQDFWSAAGVLSGWTISWLAERRFIKFDCDGSKKQKAVRFVVGILLLGFVYGVAAPAMVAGFNPNLGEFLKYFIMLVFIGCLFPAGIKFVQVRSGT